MSRLQAEQHLYNLQRIAPETSMYRIYIERITRYRKNLPDSLSGRAIIKIAGRQRDGAGWGGEHVLKSIDSRILNSLERAG